jgi:hypothetical protein
MLEGLLNQVRNAISQHYTDQNGGMHPPSLIEQIEGLFSSHAANNGQVLPASEDPYGDPADGRYAGNRGGYGNVLPASQDPLGDPADDDILPASRDPLGDPADAGRRW